MSRGSRQAAVSKGAAKQFARDLAILGGAPAFDEPLHVGRPNIGDRERLRARIDDLLDRRWLTNNGPYVQGFEAQIERTLGVRHCIAMCNATVALEIAIRALGMRGEVIIPSFTFVATAHALQWQEITPVFCDIDCHTHTIDPTQIERHITPRTTGIIGVHVWGRPCDTEALEEIARRRRLKLLFDAAHGFACSHQGKMIGNFGEAEVLSFHATKFLNSLEGGAIVTNNDDLAVKIRLMKNFGFAGYDNVVYIGTNGKMNEMSAAMGLTSLESLDKFIATNRNNYHAYKDLTRGIDGVHMVEYEARERTNYQYVVFEVDASQCSLTRDELLQVLIAENVLARRYFFPGCHRMEPYRSLFPHASLLLSETERLADRVLSLPTGTAVERSEIETICRVIRLAVENAGEVREAMAQRAEPRGGRP
jgi:dTDP-4-amino-4,6-dideoxygalactose transaminase